MIGANDVTSRTRPAVSVRHLADAVRRLTAAGCEVVVGTCPDLGTIRPIAQPLRTFARRWSREMAAAQTVAVVEAGGRTVSLGSVLGPAFASDRSMFSVDEFHPSAVGYAQAAAVLLPSVADAVGVWPAPPTAACAPSAAAPCARSPGPRRGRPAGPAPRSSRPRCAAPTPARAARGRCCAAAGPPTSRRPSRWRSRRRPPPSAEGRRGRACRALPRSSFGGDPSSADRPRTRLIVEDPMPEAVIVATARSPIGRAFKGSLKDLRPDDLAATIVRAALDKVPALDPHDIDDLMLGCGLPGGEQGYNMGRVVAILLGMDHLPGTTITRYCSSSLQTTRMAMHAIKAGEGDVFISAGVEMVSRFVKGNSDSLPDTQNPVFADARGPRRQGRRERRRLAGPTRARTATSPTSTSRWARPRRTSRCSRTSPGRRWTSSPSAARTWPRRPSTTASGSGRSPRSPRPTAPSSARTTARGPAPPSRRCRRLKPVFRPDGRVTAGNACPLNDGAAAVIVMSDTKARELGLTPLARIVSTAVTGLSPEIMGYGPVEASKLALKRAGMSIGDIDLVEINEAFAAQVIPSYRDLGIDIDQLNVHGGAIAVGHPFGMTGARITGTLINGLQTQDKTFGLETMCVGGGMGMAMVLERLS